MGLYGDTLTRDMSSSKLQTFGLLQLFLRIYAGVAIGPEGWRLSKRQNRRSVRKNTLFLLYRPSIIAFAASLPGQTFAAPAGVPCNGHH